MLTVDQRPFKRAVHELIDAVKDDCPPIHPNVFVGQISQLAIKHRIVITAEAFGLNIWKLVLSHNSARAHKLVDSISDEGPSISKVVLWVSAKVIFKYGGAIVLILLTLWVFNKCGA